MLTAKKITPSRYDVHDKQGYTHLCIVKGAKPEPGQAQLWHLLDDRDLYLADKNFDYALITANGKGAVMARLQHIVECTAIDQ